jgi:hypothetical protein
MTGISRTLVRNNTPYTLPADKSEAALSAVNEYKLYRKKMDSRR